MIDYDQIAAEYARHRQVHPGVLEALHAAAGSASRVLEVGCGTGNYIIALCSSLDCSCWGIDPSEQMLSRAREHATHVRFCPGRAEHSEFADDSFDLVFSVDVIHHVRDPAQYFREAYRVLNPRGTERSGQICTVTDSECIIRHRQPLSVYFPETVDRELERYPRISELRTLMEQAGFDEITEDTVEFPYPLTDIQAYRDKAYSSLHLISEEAFQRGIARMERDLRAGPIPCVSRYTLLWGRKWQP